MFSERQQSSLYLDELREHGVSDTKILEYILLNNLPAYIAHQAMRDARDEFIGDFLYDKSLEETD